MASSLACSAAAEHAAGGCAIGGVGRRTPRELPARPSAAARGRITVWSWDVAAQALGRLGRAFERSRPGAAVEVPDIGYGNAYDKITVGMRSGTGLPDILTVEGSRLPGYTENFPGALCDLAAPGARHARDFDAASWRTVTGRGGRLYGLPWDIGPCALYCRSDHFRAAGVTPGALALWADFVRAAVRIKERTGRKALVMDPSTPGPLPELLQQQGQGCFTRDGEVAIGGGEAVRALSLMKDLADRDLIHYERGWDGLVSATKEGRVAAQPTAACAVFARLAPHIPPVTYTKDESTARDILTATVTGVLLHGDAPAPALRSVARTVAGATGRSLTR